LVSDIDRFFGDDRNYQEANDSVLQMDLVRVAGYGGEKKIIPAVRAKVHLPIAEQRMHLVLETNPDKNAGTDPKQTQPLQKSTSPQSYAAALRYEKADAERWHFSADSGVKFQGLHTAPFARSRASLAIPKGEWRIKVAESVFWFNTLGVGETTQLDFERPISAPLLFRATSTAAWLNNTQNFDLRQDFTLFHTLDERNALLYQTSVVGVSHPQVQVTDYVVLMLYRYRLHRDWMFVELSPQLHFPKEMNFHSSPMFSLRLEMLFDESK
jgi:hypothetical protein